MNWICGKNLQAIDAGRLARQIGPQPGFELIQGKANEEDWIWVPRDGPMRRFIVTGRSTIGRVRRVGYAPVRFPLQHRALAGAQLDRCRGSRTRDLSEGFTQLRILSA